MKRILFLLALLPLQAQALEEDIYKFLHFSCIPEVGHFEIAPATMNDIGDLLYPPNSGDNTALLAKKYGLHIEGNGEYSCKLGKETIRVEYSVPDGGQSGRCSGGTRSFVSLWIGGTQITDKLVFNDDCYNTTAIKIDYNRGVLGLILHPLRSASEPVKTYYSYIDLDLEGKKFSLRKEQPLPITMEHVENELVKLISGR